MSHAVLREPLLSITVAEPYGRNWEQIYMRHPGPVIDHSSSQSIIINQTITLLSITVAEPYDRDWEQI
jgi:hypothetical protein